MLAVLPSTVPSLQPAVASASRAPSAKNAEVNLLSPFQPYQPWNNPGASCEHTRDCGGWKERRGDMGGDLGAQGPEAHTSL